MKKTAQIILFLVTGVIIMCIAVTIPLVHFYAIYQGILDFDYYVYQHNHYFFTLKEFYLDIFFEKLSFLGFYLFIYMFLSISLLILGSNLLLNNKIEKMLLIKRIMLLIKRSIYIAIILCLFLHILMTLLFPPIFFLLFA
jgi:hypothetical protein